MKTLLLSAGLAGKKKLGITRSKLLFGKQYLGFSSFHNDGDVPGLAIQMYILGKRKFQLLVACICVCVYKLLSKVCSKNCLKPIYVNVGPKNQFLSFEIEKYMYLCRFGIS